MMKHLTIIGSGPAALMLAANIDTKKYQVILCEKNKSLGRKFLVAGEGGLNLTHNSPVYELIAKYSPSEFMAPIINQFTNDDLINWLNNHGIATVIGSSNRVFADFDQKPIEVLNKIIKHIESKGVSIKTEMKWTGWNESGDLCFDNGEEIKSDMTVFALGGASWKVTGSDGLWSNMFKNKGVSILPFRAANCAFGVNWNKEFINVHEGKPLKNIALNFQSHSSKGELVITKFGLEGNAIYALSKKIQDVLQSEKTAEIYLDLKPTMTVEQIKAKYKKSRLKKNTDILKTDLNLDRLSIALLKLFSDKNTFLNPDLLAEKIKSIPIIIYSAGEVDKAITTLGGIDLDEIDVNFQLKKMPDIYAIGEMLDWFAPTGGYNLQGCFSMGYALAKYLNEL